MTTPARARATARSIADRCVAVRLRLLNRAVSGVFDAALRPHGLTVAQLNVLVAVTLLEHARPSDVAAVLRIEKSTLSRNLERMRRAGWITSDPDDDPRRQRLSVTAAGRRLLAAAAPAWEAAQEEAEGLLGAGAVSALGHAGNRLMGTPPEPDR